MPIGAALRTTTAWADGGRQFYSVPADLAAELATCLDEAADVAIDPVVRAVRLYFDLCFVHPFVDGNGRAARLAFDAVSWRAGLQLRSVCGLFSLQRDPADRLGVRHFGWQANRQVELR